MADSNGCQVRGHVGENQEYHALPERCSELLVFFPNRGGYFSEVVGLGRSSDFINKALL